MDDYELAQKYETVNLFRRGGAAKIELNRPETRNAWNTQFSVDLLTALHAVGEVLPEIGPAGERLAGPGDEHRPDAGIAGGLTQRGKQVDRELGVPRVPGFRAVQLDLRRAAAAVHIQGLVLVSRLVVVHDASLG